MQIRALLIAGAMVATGIAAHADTLPGVYSVTVSEGSTGQAFDTATGNPYSGSNTASATFTYTGLLNFDNTAAQNDPGKSGDKNVDFGFSTANISNYSGSGKVVDNQGAGTTVANYNTLANFLASSGSASGFDYGSYYTFDLGVLNAGTVLTVTHDDGISIFQGSTQVGSTASGPTSVTTDTVRITNTGDTVLRYARENGTPSILQVSATTPEPSSLALLGTGLLGLAGAARRRFRR